MFVLLSNACFANSQNKKLNLTCQDYSWSDVQVLVSPYLDDDLYTALVMQGLSSNYKTAIAAQQAMDKSLPEIIKKTLQSLIDADC
jgi:hypothetical protein